MEAIRVLVIEDNSRWQETIKEIIERLAQHIDIRSVATYDEAFTLLTNNIYDLTTIDISLVDGQPADEKGLELLGELQKRHHDFNSCGLLILTGSGTKPQLRRAFNQYRVDDVIEKDDFDNNVFLDIVRTTLRKTWLRRAEAHAATRYQLVITCDQDRIISSELKGPERQLYVLPDTTRKLDYQGFIERTNNLNILALQDFRTAIQLGGSAISDTRRRELQRISKDIYQALRQEAEIADTITVARSSAQGRDLLVQFRTPSIGLGMPFEFMHDGNDYLCSTTLVARKYLHPGAFVSRKTEPFHRFIDTLVKSGQLLKVLVIGANSDGSIPEAEQEAKAVADVIERSTQLLGIPATITSFIGAEATCSSIRKTLQEGGYHLLHYAGHGRYIDVLPELSGIVLQDGTLTAVDLYTLTKQTDLHQVYLSCCLSARTSIASYSNDFSGVFGALAQADVPVLLGYRWTIADDAAYHMALTFYTTLWRTFSPSKALYIARQAQVLKQGRSDESWLSPVLIVQNA